MRRSFEELVQLALAIELVLVAAGEIVPGADHLLPLGNSHLKQVAAAIVIAIAFHTFGKFFGGSRRSGAKPSRTDKDCVSALEESRGLAASNCSTKRRVWLRQCPRAAAPDAFGRQWVGGG